MRLNWLICFVLCTSLGATVFGQGTQIKKAGVNINGNCNAYLEYTPPGYNPAGTQKYPLLLFFGGNGSQGAGTTTTLDQFFTSSGTPADQCKDGSWVPTFTVNGQTFSFIVITPQFIRPFCCSSIPTPGEVDDVINYMVQHYKVDESRIYLTGISSGAAIPFEYTSFSAAFANKIAAISTFATVSWGDQTKADVLRNAHMPVWAFHNDLDVNPPSIFTNNWISLLNTPATMTPAPRKTIFYNVPSHDCWYATYTRYYTENNMNLYEWMLQYSRAQSANSPLPVKFASLNAECQNGGTTVRWTTTMEENTSGFDIESSADGRGWTKQAFVAAQGAGGAGQTYASKIVSSSSSMYRIVAIDLDGRKTYSQVLRSDCGSTGGLSVFPNPVVKDANIQINLKTAAVVAFRLIDAKGASYDVLVKSVPAGATQLSIDLSRFAAGSYQLLASWPGGQSNTGILKR